MNWAIELSKEAKADLKRLPRDTKDQLVAAIDEMEEDPLRRNVKALHGPGWKGLYRKRVGRYRIIFAVNYAAKSIHISAIVARSEKTYR